MASETQEQYAGTSFVYRNLVTGEGGYDLTHTAPASTPTDPKTWPMTPFDTRATFRPAAPAGQTAQAASSSARARCIRRRSTFLPPPHLRSLGIVLDLAKGEVAALRGVKVELDSVKQSIGDERRRSGGGAELDLCLAGFHAYVTMRFSPVVPMRIGAAAVRTLFHESGCCAVFGVCALPTCDWHASFQGVTLEEDDPEPEPEVAEPETAE